MPISKYNPDGSVDIYNTVTGEVKTGVKPEELISISPKLVAEYQAGQSPEKVVERTKSQKELESIISGKPVLTADEQKQVAKISDLGKSIELLEKNLAEAEKRGPVSGRYGKTVASLTGGSFFPEVADYEALRKSMIGPVARTISAEAGVLTDQDIKRAEGMLPKVTDSITVARNKLNNIKALVEEKSGKESKIGTIDTAKEKGILKSIYDFFLGTGTRTAQDVGAGQAIKSSGINESQQNAMSMAMQAMDKAQQTSDPEQKRRLMQVAQDAFRVSGEGAKDISGLASEDINKSVASRSLGTGLDVAATTGLISGGINLVKNPPKVSKLLSPRKSLAEARNLAAEQAGGSFEQSKKKLLEAGKKALVDNPGAKSEWVKSVKPSIENASSPMDLLRKLDKWNRWAFTKSGGIKSAKAADLYAAMSRSGNEILRDVAPEAAKLQSILKLSHQIPEKLSKGAYQALKFSALGRILGL